jgi:hypothetical protein
MINQPIGIPQGEERLFYCGPHRKFEDGTCRAIDNVSGYQPLPSK